jgi:hypothetical protein
MPSDKIDERIIHMINYLLNGGVELFTPPVEVERIAGNMEAIKALLEIRRKVDDTESELPSQQDMEELFTKVGDVLSGIIAGVVLVGWQSILSQIRISQLVEGLKAEYDIKDTNNKD